MIERGALEIAPLFPHDPPKIWACMPREAGRAQLAHA
jgi:hypothetical protein